MYRKQARAYPFGRRPMYNFEEANAQHVGLSFHLSGLYPLDIIGAADGTELEVGPDDLTVGVLGDDLGGNTGGGGAWATVDTRLAGTVDGVARVKPEHVGEVLCDC